MSLQPDNGGFALLKHFLSFSALNIAVWVIGGTLLWWLSRYVPLWVIGVVIFAGIMAVMIFGNKQDAKKRADMTRDLNMRK